MQAALRLAPIVRYGDGSRAGNILKKLSEDQLEKRIAYEVSVSKLERMD